MQLPENVQTYLQREFRLSAEDMRPLRCIRRGGSFAGYPVTFIRIFDGERAYVDGQIIRDYRDLDRHPEFMLFEGHVFRDGIVCLNKKKAEAALVK